MPLAIPQLIHLSTLHQSFHGTCFAVQARVTFVFRTDDIVSRVRVTSLSPSATVPFPDVDLLLRGRWCVALSCIVSGVILHIEYPSVRRNPHHDSVDSQHSLRLELDDDPSVLLDNVPAVYILDERKVPILVATAATLDVGTTPPTPSVLRRFCTAASAGGSSRPRVVVGERKCDDYEYTSIATIADAGDQLSSKKLNVFGVIVDARAPCVTRGTDLRSEIILADKSSCMPDGTLKTVAAHRFEREPKDSIPFRAFGDIVRIHRSVCSMYTDRTAGRTASQLNVRFFSTVLLWRYDDDSFHPCLVKDPVRVSGTSRSRHTGPVHHVTQMDRVTIQELRQWVRSYLLQRLVGAPRPYLRSVLEVSSMMQDVVGATVDLLGRVVSIEMDGPNIKLIMTDGLVPQLSENSRTVVICSQTTLADLRKVRANCMTDLYPWWKARPRLPMWAFVKDGVLQNIHGGRRILMTVGFATTTILFVDEEAPMVRALRESYRRVMEGAAAVNENHVHGVAVQHSPETIAQAEEGAMTVVPQAVQVRAAAGPEGRNAARETSVMTNVAAGQDHGRGEEEIGVDNSGNGGIVSKRSRKQNDGTESTISEVESAYADVEMSTIEILLRNVREGKDGVHRVKVWARACLLPRDVAYACRPWCQSCAIFADVSSVDVEEEGIACVECGAVLGMEGGLQWVFAVKLRLEDESDGRIDVWVEGEEGRRFFTGLDGSHLLDDVSGRQKLRRCLQAVLSARNRLECCVHGYEYMDEEGMYHVAGKMVGTKLKAGLVDGGVGSK